MKNLDMILFLWLRRLDSQRSLDVALKWLGSHRHSRLEILLAFDNHAVTRL